MRGMADETEIGRECPHPLLATPARGRVLTVLALQAVFATPLVTAPRDETEKEIRRLQQAARDQRLEKRVEAYAALFALGERGIEALRGCVLEQWREDHRTFDNSLRAGVLRRGVRWVAAELERRRTAALEVIFDLQRYPDEAHGASGQAEVDRLVTDLREVYATPAVAWRRGSADADALWKALESDSEWLARSGATPPPTAPTLGALVERANAIYVVRDSLLDARNRDVQAYNERDVLTSVDEEERLVVEETNKYRAMMGLPILEIDERLVRAARAHSREMRDLGYFGHDSPIDANRTPTLRARREGYRAPVAENIAKAASGLGAFQSWCRSSGHHRNMLGKHDQIGVGRDGDLLTQCFGSGDSLRSHPTAVLKDPELLYLARLREIDEMSADDQAGLAEWCRSRHLDDKMREHARRALEIDPDHATARRLLGYRRVAGEWVGDDSTDAEPAREVSALLRRLRHADSAERLQAVGGLAAYDEKRVRVALRNALADEAAEVRAEAARALAARADKEALRDIAKLLEDRNVYTRHAACRALLELGDARGIAVLLHDLDAPEDNARINSAKVLTEISGETMGYRWDLPLEERRAAIERWRKWWEENLGRVLEHSSRKPAEKKDGR
ncbi:MAG: CAP domain-containing protein [Planctomycetota bacterium]